MGLRRVGNKKRLARKINAFFPKHSSYCELFFGAGGMFFNKLPVSEYNFLNDMDNDVINYWNVLKYRSSEMLDAFEELPIHQTLWQEFKIKRSSDEVSRAIEFLMLSNFGYLGMPETLRYSTGHDFGQTLKGMREVLKYFNRTSCKFLCHDFKSAIDVVYRSVRDPSTLFFYADPPYVGTHGNYNSFTINDLDDLIRLLLETKCDFLISEFASAEVIDLIKSHGLKYEEIIERATLKSVSTELVAYNYEIEGRLF